MTRSISFLAVMSLVWLSGSVLAAEPCDKPLGSQLRCASCAVNPCWCPDDYCRKPLPRIPCLPLRYAADDYCRKPLPRIPCPALGGCADDYCRKPLPDL
jgi:hypothetical protein